ncbi:MAG: hypothetical protein OEQ39_04490 [Gammaproteobacteria bacterium]|nr:hypothetical protein [Gammaproteobacteria bacterium]
MIFILAITIAAATFVIFFGVYSWLGIIAVDLLALALIVSGVVALAKFCREVEIMEAEARRLDE